VSDRGSSDPAIVDRRPAPRRAEPGDQERPNFGHRLVHGEGFEPPAQGSANADFILDGLLLNGKAITAPARLGRDEISQPAATFCSITTKRFRAKTPLAPHLGF
jgi:hypothetical protein